MKEYRPKKSRWSTIATLIITQVLFAIVLNFSYPGFSGMPLWIWIVWILMFTLTLTAIIKTLKNKPTFIINENGIIDSVGFHSCGEIPWKNIKEIILRKVGNTNFICFDLYDESEILNRSNFLKRFVMKSNQRRLGTICVIPEAALNEKLDVVLDELTKYSTQANI